MKINDYFLVTDTKCNGFSTTVKSFIEKGYIPQGSIDVIKFNDPITKDINFLFSQAMIKYEEEKPNFRMHGYCGDVTVVPCSYNIASAQEHSEYHSRSCKCPGCLYLEEQKIKERKFVDFLSWEYPFNETTIETEIYLDNTKKTYEAFNYITILRKPGSLKMVKYED